jgi:hypothetical protein
MYVAFGTQFRQFVDGFASAVLQNRNYRGLPGVENRASILRINSTVLSIASGNVFFRAGLDRPSSVRRIASLEPKCQISDD